MIERRPFLDFLTHVVLILGVIIVAFPVYVVFVASSLTAEDVLQAPMTLIPGPHLIENYRTVLTHGMGNSATPVGTMLMNSLIMALGHFAREDRHLHHLGLRDRLFQVPPALRRFSG